MWWCVLRPGCSLAVWLPGVLGVRGWFGGRRFRMPVGWDGSGLVVWLQTGGVWLWVCLMVLLFVVRLLVVIRGFLRLVCVGGRSIALGRVWIG